MEGEQQAAARVGPGHREGRIRIGSSPPRAMLHWAGTMDSGDPEERLPGCRAAPNWTSLCSVAQPWVPPASGGAAARGGVSRPGEKPSRPPPPTPRPGATPCSSTPRTRLPTVWLASCFIRLNCFFMAAAVTEARGAPAGQGGERPGGSTSLPGPSGGSGGGDYPGPAPPSLASLPATLPAPPAPHRPAGPSRAE
jgi:hypothetical protein